MPITVDKHSFPEDRHVVHRAIGTRLRDARERRQELPLFAAGKNERIGSKFLWQRKILDLEFRSRLVREFHLQWHSCWLPFQPDQRRVARGVRKAALGACIRIARGNLLNFYREISNCSIVTPLGEIELERRLLLWKEQLPRRVRPDKPIILIRSIRLEDLQVVLQDQWFVISK